MFSAEVERYFIAKTIVEIPLIAMQMAVGYSARAAGSPSGAKYTCILRDFSLCTPAFYATRDALLSTVASVSEKTRENYEIASTSFFRIGTRFSGKSCPDPPGIKPAPSGEPADSPR